MKKFAFKKLLILSSLFFGLTSCLKDNDDFNKISVAGLTMINAYQPSASIYHVADQNFIQPPHSPLPYSSYNYANLFPGNRKIKVFAEGKSLIDTSYSFTDSTFFTSVTFGTEEEPVFLILKDVGLNDLNTNSAVRFFHLANDVAAVNVSLGTKENIIFSSRPREKTSITQVVNNIAEFKKANTGVQKIIVSDYLTGETIIEKEHEFKTKKYYSILFMGDPASENKPLKIGIAEQY